MDSIIKRGISAISIVSIPLILEYFTDFEYNDLKNAISLMINSYGNISLMGDTVLAPFQKGKLSRDYHVIKSILTNNRNNIFENARYYINSPDIELLTRRCNNRKYIYRKTRKKK